MSSHINEDLKASGIAQVIVVLKSPAAVAGAAALRLGAAGAFTPPSGTAAPAFAGLEKHFETSELSQMSALARSGIAEAASLGQAHTLALRSIRQPPPQPQPPPAVQFYPNLGIMLGTVTRAGLTSLRADERVESVTGTPQFSLIKPVLVADAALSNKITWGIEALGVPRLWKEGLSGKGVRVAHLDTGADGKHPALKRAFAAFAEFDFMGQRVNPDPAPHDTDEHGTHTAATIAGRDVKGQHVGVAPGAQLASAIVIEGGLVINRILGGMDWAISEGARVLSMSLGIRGFIEDFIPITQILRSKNVLPVIAVGNEGPGQSRSPGNYPESLSVGAVDKNLVVAPFSSSQRFVRKDEPLVPDLVAPGVDVISAKPQGGFQLMSGSSMATPHIAGLAALLFEAAPGSTIDAVEQAIFQSCKRGPGMSVDRSNRGFPGAVEALAALTGVTLGKTGSSKKAAQTTSATKAQGKTAKSGKSRKASAGTKKPAKAAQGKKAGSKKASRK
jgi:subtilisin family serine protease